MRIASISDIHLGAALAGRVQGGRPVRQVDIETALDAAVGGIIAHGCAVVLICGDVFDVVSPCTAAKLAYLRAMQMLSDNGIEVVVIGGNHEVPRTAGVVCPNRLAEGMDLVQVVSEPGPRPSMVSSRIAYFCAPFQALAGEQVIVPEADPNADVNILLIHAAVRSSARPDALPRMYGGPTSYDVARAGGFDIVACGDFHEFRVLAAPYGWTGGMVSQDGTAPSLAFYSGSLERVSSNIWSESAPKGWVLVDTDARTLEFVRVPTRPMIDFGTGDFHEGSVNEVCADVVNGSLESILADPNTADALVRLTAPNFPREEKDRIDWRLVQALKQRCVLFNLDIRFADREQREFVDRRRRAAHSLADDARLYAEDFAPPVRERFLTHLGLDAEVPAHV